MVSLVGTWMQNGAQQSGISFGAVIAGAIALAFNLLQLWRVPRIRRLQ
jgi:hypothetical protein